MCGAKQTKQPNNNGPINNNQPTRINGESDKEHKLLFTQCGVNEPTSGGESSLSVPLSIETLITMRFSKELQELEFS